MYLTFNSFHLVHFCPSMGISRTYAPNVMLSQDMSEGELHVDESFKALALSS